MVVSFLKKYPKEVLSYCSATALCIILIATLYASVPASHSARNNEFSRQLFDAKTLAESADSPFFRLVSVFYFFFFIFGVANFIVFVRLSLKKADFVAASGRFMPHALTAVEVWRLFFWIAFLYLVLTVGGIGIFSFLNFNRNVYYQMIILLNTASNIITILLLLAFIPWNSFGLSLRKKDFISAIRLYSALLVLLYLLVPLLTLVSEKFKMTPTYNPAAYILIALQEDWLIAILIIEIILLAPLCEELFFRGFAYKLLRHRLDFWRSAVIISILFALLHRSLFGFPVIFLISMALCYLYERTHAIYPAVFFHSIHNSFGILYILLIKNTISS